jgi:O-antigen/teichoic acid export membrane protein
MSDTSPDLDVPEAIERPSSPEQFSPDELRAATVSGARWTALSRAIYEVLAFSASVALTRLVSPAETGAAAVALVVPMLATIVTFEGFGSALVQADRVTGRDEGTALTLSLMLGVALTVLSVLTATTVAGGVFSERTAELLLLISPSFLLAAFSTVPRARLQRRLAFAALSMNDVIVFAANIAVAIPLAIAGAGGAALVAGMLCGQAVGSAVLVRRAHLPRPAFGRSEARSLLQFGLPASTAGLIFSGRKALPWVILGAVLPAALVGQFYRAYQLGAEYQAKVSSIMLTMVFALFSRTPDIGALRELRGRIVRLNSLALAPLLGLLAVIAPEVVGVLYGPDWAGAVASTRVLTLVGLLSVLMAGTESVALALGRPRALLAFHAAFAAIYLVVLAVAVRHTSDLVIVSWAAVGVHLLLLVLAQQFLMKPLLGLGLSELWRDAGPACASTLVACTATWGVVDLLRAEDLAAFPTAFLGGLVQLVVYLAVLRAAFPRAFGELGALRRLVRRSG